MKSFKRVERVAPLIQEILSDLIRRSTQDPRVRCAAITRVEMKDDLRLARVYYEVSPGSDPAEAQVGFDQARSFLRRQMGAQLAMKYIPELRFIYDDRHEHVARVEAILRTLNEDPS
jgi:ribosome-binding factor A